MFTHAGFNGHGRRLFRALVYVRGYPGRHRATFVIFEPSGEAAWWVRGVCIAWPEHVRIHDVIGNTPDVWRYGYGENRSRLPE